MGKKYLERCGLSLEVVFFEDEDERGTYAIVEEVYACHNGNRISDNLLPILSDEVIDSLATEVEGGYE